MKRLAVYCGASMGSDPAFAEVARALGESWPGAASAWSSAAAIAG